MCTLCSELDHRLDQCPKLSASITDQLTLNGIDLLIEKCDADKQALHSGSATATDGLRSTCLTARLRRPDSMGTA
jgi:hypothetical protein